MVCSKRKKPKINIRNSIVVKLLLLALVFALVPFLPAHRAGADINKYGRTADGEWTYKLIDQSKMTVAIRPTKITTLPASVQIPSKVTVKGEEYKVVQVGKCAFEHCLCNDCLKKNKKSLEVAWENSGDGYTGEELDRKYSNITIPSSVVLIDENAFADVEMDKLTFESPSSLESMKMDAFNGVIVKNITIPKSVTSIGETCFANSEISSVDFADGSKITSLGDGAFDSSELKSISLPSSLKTINEDCFKESALKSIKIPSSVTKIEKNAFAGCTKLEDIDFASDGSLSKIDDAAFFGTKLTSLTIPSYVTSIGDWAFSNMNKLKSLTFGTKKALSGYSKLAFVKVLDFEIGSDDYDSLDSCDYKTNSVIEDAYIEDYDIYRWICDKKFLGDDATVHSNKTRIFIDSRNNSKGDVKGDATIDFTTYFTKEKKGYHYENKAYEYGNKGKFSNTNKVKMNNNTFESKKYPYVILSADFDPIKYKIAYEANANDVSNMPTSNTDCVYDEEVHFSKKEPKRVGYTFRGWSKSKSGKGTFYRAGQRVKENFTSTHGEVVNMYAGWDVVKVNIKVNANGGETNQKEVKGAYGSKLSDVLFTPTRDGYDFIGWSLTDDGKVLDKDYKIDKLSDFAVYAKWKKNTKKITISFSTPKNTGRDSFYEITISRNGQTIQNHNVMASDMGIEKIVLTGAKKGEKYIITCTNYIKKKGKRKYFDPVIKEVVIK